MVVLEQPEQGRALERFYDKVLRTAGLSRDTVWTTYQFKCPIKSGQPTAAQRDACKVWLWRELEIVKPSVIFVFGGNPTNLLLRRKTILNEVVGKVHYEDYLPAGRTAIIPFPSLHKLLNGKREDVCDCAELMKSWKSLSS